MFFFLFNAVAVMISLVVHRNLLCLCGTNMGLNTLWISFNGGLSFGSCISQRKMRTILQLPHLTLRWSYCETPVPFFLHYFLKILAEPGWKNRHWLWNFITVKKIWSFPTLGVCRNIFMVNMNLISTAKGILAV